MARLTYAGPACVQADLLTGIHCGLRHTPLCESRLADSEDHVMPVTVSQSVSRPTRPIATGNGLVLVSR